MERQMLYNTHGLLLLFTGISVALLYRTVQTDKRDPSALWIAATTFSGGLGLLLMSSAHTWPVSLLGCILFLATPPLLHIAVGFAARETIRRTLPLAVGLSLTGLALRAMTGSTVIALLPVPAIEVLTLWLLLRNRHSVTRTANLVMAAFMALHIISFSFRIHIIASRLPHSGVLAYSGMLTVVGLGISFVGMEAIRSRHEFERMAMTDSLTGLLNRRALDLFAPRELQRCARNGKPCSALMIDIDHFKQVNDTFGHAAGDAALCAVAGILQSLLRPGNVITRHGGDEFFVLLSECGEEDVSLVVARLRHAIDSCTLDVSGGKALQLSISIGAATLLGNEVTVQDLLHASDSMLYREKLSSHSATKVQRLDELSTDGGGAQVQPSNA